MLLVVQSSTDPLVPRRWPVLVAFALLVAATQLLWLSFASITDQTAQVLGVATGSVGDLAVINPAVFVLLAIPAGRWMDRHYGRALAAGAVFTGVGALVRLLDPTSFAVVALGQTVMSLGQPLVLNASTKIAARYFPERQQTTAISVATAAQFAGILLAVLTSAPLYDAGGLPLLLGTHAGFAVLAGVAVLASLRVAPLARLDAASVAADGIGWLRGDTVMWKLAGLLFVGFGAYNALATWLDSILSDFGHDGVAGPAIAATTLAGVVGAAVLPGLVAGRDARRTHCLVTTGVLAAGMLLLVLTHAVATVVVVLVVVGFFVLGTLPIVLDWSELHAGSGRAATATGFLLLAGNLGAVFIVLTVQVVIDHPRAALVVMAAWALPGLAAALALPRRVTPVAAG